jgi:hypothetical protein
LAAIAFSERRTPSKLKLTASPGVVNAVAPTVAQSVCTGSVGVLPNWPVWGQLRLVGRFGLCWNENV